MLRATVLCAFLVLTATVTPARAELVFFQSGRAMSVKAIRSDGDGLVLYLRSGGEVYCDRALIARVEPDEVEYPEEAREHPEEALDAVPLAKAVQEPDDIDILTPYRELIARTAARHGVDARVVNALIQVESGYRSRAVSPKGARGLMQIMPATGRQYGALDLFDPKVNLDAGVQHLRKLLSRYALPVALAAYNAGEAAVDRFGGVPPFRETQNYVARILRLLGRS